MPLTDAKIRSAKAGPKPIKLTDGAGLYLEVRPTGAKFWRYRYRIAGKENVYAMGEYPTLSLSEARQRRSEARALVTKGIHPAKHRKAAQLVQQTQNATTFEAVAREWMEGKATNWTPGYAQQVHRCFEAEVFPQIGAFPVRDVEAAHLLEIMRRLDERGAANTALLIRQWCSAVFSLCCGHLESR